MPALVPGTCSCKWSLSSTYACNTTTIAQNPSQQRHRNLRYSNCQTNSKILKHLSCSSDPQSCHHRHGPLIFRLRPQDPGPRPGCTDVRSGFGPVSRSQHCDDYCKEQRYYGLVFEKVQSQADDTQAGGVARFVCVFRRILRSRYSRRPPVQAAKHPVVYFGGRHEHPEMAMKQVFRTQYSTRYR